MSRKAREKSSLGIYMIYLKAIEGIVFDTEDKIAFLNIISNEDVSLLGYTLLNNSFSNGLSDFFNSNISLSPYFSLIIQ